MVRKDGNDLWDIGQIQDIQTEKVWKLDSWIGWKISPLWQIMYIGLLLAFDIPGIIVR